MRGLAVTTRERVTVVPDMPTIAESGVPGFDVSSWFGFFVPVKTPSDIIARINADTNAALAYPSVKSRFDELGADPEGLDAGRACRLPANRKSTNGAR